MPSRPEVNALGGIWPLGIITVTAGTPVSILSNVGAQGTGAVVGSPAPVGLPGGQSASWSGRGRPFSATCRQLMLSTTGNTGLIYINDGNWPGKDTNRTVAIIGPNQPNVAFPPNPLTESVMDLSRYWIDGSSSGDTIVIAAADASS